MVNRWFLTQSRAKKKVGYPNKSAVRGADARIKSCFFSLLILVLVQVLVEGLATHLDAGRPRLLFGETACPHASVSHPEPEGREERGRGAYSLLWLACRLSSRFWPIVHHPIPCEKQSTVVAPVIYRSHHRKLGGALLHFFGIPFVWMYGKDNTIKKKRRY